MREEPLGHRCANGARRFAVKCLEREARTLVARRELAHTVTEGLQCKRIAIQTDLVTNWNGRIVNHTICDNFGND